MFQVFSASNRGLLEDFTRMEQRLDELFGAWPRGREIRYAGQGAYPPVNVGGTADTVEVYVYAAGLDPARLDISIQQNVLSIAGERRVERPEKAQFYRQERFSGSFHRAISLPEDVDPERVEATYRDGVLRISVRRRESSKPRQIAVKCA